MCGCHWRRLAALRRELLVLGLAGLCTSSLALPGFDPFTSAVGLAANGTSYAAGAPLYHQTNAFGEGWALWNGGSGSATAEVQCVTNGLAYAGFPAGFPAPPATNAVLIPGMDQGVNAYGYSAALMFSRSVAADTNNLVTNKIYASFLLQVPGIGNLATTGTQPIYFGGFDNSTSGDQSTQTPPGKCFKLFLEGNSSTAGASTQWALGIADNSGGSTERFDPSFRTTNTVLFVVVDYEFGISGGNDNARLWVNPACASFGAAVAPAPTTNITITAASGNELGQAASFFLFCRSGATLWGSILISDLRIGTTWSFVTGGPEFASQPVSQSAAAGATVSLQAVAVAGGSAVAYQWKQGGTNLTNGGNISGATTGTLTFTGVTATNAGSYSVTASNALGSVSSSIATLTVTAGRPAHHFSAAKRDQQLPRHGFLFSCRRWNCALCLSLALQWQPHVGWRVGRRSNGLGFHDLQPDRRRRYLPGGGQLLGCREQCKRRCHQRPGGFSRAGAPGHHQRAAIPR